VTAPRHFLGPLMRGVRDLLMAEIFWPVTIGPLNVNSAPVGVALTPLSVTIDNETGVVILTLQARVRTDPREGAIPVMDLSDEVERTVTGWEYVRCGERFVIAGAERTVNTPPTLDERGNYEVFDTYRITTDRVGIPV
jgi:hypothetical protein